MHLVLSGEGNTDIGKLSYPFKEFVPAPMYYLIDKIIEKKLNYSFYEKFPNSITFIPESELLKITKKEKIKRRVPHTGKNTKKETAYYLVNAMTLAHIAKVKSKELNDDVIAILFRDSDGTNRTIKHLWKDKIDSIEKGFKIEKFYRGVAMIPNPKSEAWLICALKENPYENCKKLENKLGNDKSPKNRKDELESFGISNDEINKMIQSGAIDIDRIDMPSFEYFTKRLRELL